MRTEYVSGSLLKENIQFYGRNLLTETVCTFFWPGSGMEICVDGSELWIETYVPEDVLPPWVGVYRNNSLLAKFQLQCGVQNVCIYKGLSPDMVREIRLLKESQVRIGENDSFFSINKIKLDGKFFPVKRRNGKIEVIGDSISAGEGLSGSKNDSVWESILSSCNPAYHYGEIIGAYFQANVDVIAQGGWGIYSSFDNCPYHNIPRIYPYRCGLLMSDSGRKIGLQEIQKHEDTNVVIINLGTNDAAAFVNPGWKEEDSGIVYKQYMDSEGNFEENSAEHVIRAVAEFLGDVRKYNPNAVIYWVYGMLKNQLEKLIQSGIKAYQNESRDRRVRYILAEDTPEEEFGSIRHPGRISHQKIAQRLIREIEKDGVYSTNIKEL